MRRLTALFILCLITVPAFSQLADPNQAGITYGHIHLNVPDIEAHRALWVEHFGGVSVDKGPLKTVRLENTIVIFNEAEPSAGSRETVGGCLPDGQHRSRRGTGDSRRGATGFPPRGAETRRPDQLQRASPQWVVYGLLARIRHRSA